MDTQVRNFKVRENASNAAIPDMLTFLDMYKTSKVEDLDMYHKWLEKPAPMVKHVLHDWAEGRRTAVYRDIHENIMAPMVWWHTIGS